MILPNSRIRVNEESIWLSKIEVSNNIVKKINGESNFERILAEKKDFDQFGLKVKIVNKKPNDDNKLPLLHTGKYKVTYNQTDYFMTYLDEIDLFRRVVCQTCYD